MANPPLQVTLPSFLQYNWSECKDLRMKWPLLFNKPAAQAAGADPP